VISKTPRKPAQKKASSPKKPRPRKTKEAAALARAEQAVRRLSRVFEDAAAASIEEMRRLCGGWPETTTALYRLAHDLKGQGTTFGHPQITEIAAELCRALNGNAGTAELSRYLDKLDSALKPH
jgi:HPt (histidine-containing phosphotransfer) domain-containing protein